jgi:hypothetical protein
MNHESLLDMIRRLLALSGSPNEHEAAAAMAKAQQLLLEHGLSMEEIAASGSDDRWEESEVWQGGRAGQEASFINEVLILFFFVKIIWRRDRFLKRTSLLFFGRPQHVAVARYVFAYLQRVYRQLWTDYGRRSSLGREARGAFFLGLSKGICHRLHRERQPETAGASTVGALVVVERELQTAFDRRKGNMPKQRQRPISPCEAAEAQGIILGQRIGIPAAVSRPAPIAALPAPEKGRQRRLFA